MRRSINGSFAASIATANRRKDYQVINAMFSKEKTRRLLDALGAPVTRDFRVIGRLSRLRARDIAEGAVVKPSRSSNDRGVVALLPVGRNRWRDLLTGTEMNFSELVAALAGHRTREGFPDQWIIEELLLPADGSQRAIDDVKISMFGDRMACSFVRSNAPRGYQWFDEDWNKIDVGIHHGKLNPEIDRPEQFEQLEALARRIGAALPLPYVRVDLYATSRGPVVGELTPLPGWYYSFNEEWDQRMGLWYEERETELFRLGMDWSRLSSPPLTELFAEFAATARRRPFWAPRTAR